MDLKTRLKTPCIVNNFHTNFALITSEKPLNKTPICLPNDFTLTPSNLIVLKTAFFKPVISEIEGRVTLLGYLNHEENLNNISFPASISLQNSKSNKHKIIIKIHLKDCETNSLNAKALADSLTVDVLRNNKYGIVIRAEQVHSCFRGEQVWQAELVLQTDNQNKELKKHRQFIAEVVSTRMHEFMKRANLTGEYNVTVLGKTQMSQKEYYWVKILSLLLIIIGFIIAFYELFRPSITDHAISEKSTSEDYDYEGLRSKKFRRSRQNSEEHKSLQETSV